MTPAVAIATCAQLPRPDDENLLLLDALRAAGVRADAEVWTGEPAGGWQAYDLVVLRSTWDYTSLLAPFLQWTRAIGPARLLNPPAVVAWNADKRYVFELERAGIATIPTEHLRAGAPWRPPPGRFVVKPAVGAGSRGAAVFDGARHDAAREHVAALQADGHEVLLQPYLAAVDGAEAETALIFIDGTLSHAMRKGPLLTLDGGPVEGLFLQEQMSPVAAPEPDIVALGERTSAYVQERFGDLAYARVDVLRDGDGKPALLELELIEPSLFLDHAPGSAQALARAIVARLAQ